MRLIQTIQEMQENMRILDGYLRNKQENEYSFALELVKRGTCFIAVKVEDGYKFYPSRFTGYANNNMSRHLNNVMKDGRETNPVISKLLGQNVGSDLELEKAYRKYCEDLGFTANQKGSFGVARKYWRFAEK